ncbi:MAG: pseudouridine synthase [Anaerolineales bacterium]|nr:rRNA pseudouridine synthase [Anaerolineae bacterium]PWB50954.1 MAG: pseudouridine synthase [Anaerolineales bacterium]
MKERLQKLLAAAGYGSRRSCEALILAGRVTVNGETAQLGSKADIAEDQVKLDGKLIKRPEANQYIALYKPRGVISAVTSPDARPTIRDLVPLEGTLYPVGRLDADSEGLILLTNDGDLANQLTHPRYGHEKEYRVLVARHPDEKQLTAWRHGVVLEDGYRSAPAQVDIEANSGKGTWLIVTMKEGRKRQIRDTCRQIGLPVVTIIRVRIGRLRLGSLKAGEWRKLTENEINSLKKPVDSKSVHKPAGKQNTRRPIQHIKKTKNG